DHEGGEEGPAARVLPLLHRGWGRRRAGGGRRVGGGGRRGRGGRAGADLDDGEVDGYRLTGVGFVHELVALVPVLHRLQAERAGSDVPGELVPALAVGADLVGLVGTVDEDHRGVRDRLTGVLVGDDARDLLHRRRLVRPLHTDGEDAAATSLRRQADLTPAAAGVARSERAAPVHRDLHRAAPGRTFR